MLLRLDVVIKFALAALAGLGVATRPKGQRKLFLEMVKRDLIPTKVPLII
jgi:hypothetical protein